MFNIRSFIYEKVVKNSAEYKELKETIANLQRKVNTKNRDLKVVLKQLKTLAQDNHNTEMALEHEMQTIKSLLSLSKKKARRIHKLVNMNFDKKNPVCVEIKSICKEILAW